MSSSGTSITIAATGHPPRIYSKLFPDPPAPDGAYSRSEVRRINARTLEPVTLAEGDLFDAADDRGDWFFFSNRPQSVQSGLPLEWHALDATRNATIALGEGVEKPFRVVGRGRGLVHFKGGQHVLTPLAPR